MLADLCKSAILLGDYFLWYRRFKRSGGVFQPGWILSQARWIGIVFHRQNGDLSFFFTCGILLSYGRLGIYSASFWD